MVTFDVFGLLGQGLLKESDTPKSLNYAICGGLFYFTETYRTFAVGGMGKAFGGPIGYQKKLEDLSKYDRPTVHQLDYINEGINDFFRITLGFDYKLSQKVSWGVSYSYDRSLETTKLRNGADVYGSIHNVMLHFSIVTHSF